MKLHFIIPIILSHSFLFGQTNEKVSAIGFVSNSPKIIRQLILTADAVFHLNTMPADYIPSSITISHNGTYTIKKGIIFLHPENQTINRYIENPSDTLNNIIKIRGARTACISETYPTESLPISNQFYFVQNGKKIHLVEFNSYKDKTEFPNDDAWLKYIQQHSFKLNRQLVYHGK